MTQPLFNSYFNGFVYQDNVLQCYTHEEGYVRQESNGDFTYVYQCKDHLGNVRLSYADSNGDGVITKAELIEESNYYPFGMQHIGYNGGTLSSNLGQKLKYNGKELQEELGLGIYDYGARNYSPELGRWFNIDPLAEKRYQNSPFMYANNNPIIFIDPDGMDFTYTGQDAVDFATGMQIGLAMKEARGGRKNKDKGDDIIFRDKKGNKLGTYKDGKEKVTNVTLPIEDFGSSPNISLNKAALNLTDIDAIGLSLSGEATYGIGGGVGQEFMYFLDGKDKNQLFAYTYASITLGLGAEGFSINAIAANFLGNDANLVSNDYLGTFNYYSGSTPVAGISYFWGNSSNSVELWPGMSKFWNSDYKQTWSGVSVSAPGPNASATVGTSQYIYTPVLNNLFQKMGLQKK